MSLNDDRCPKCFRKLINPETEKPNWTNDPLLTKNGSKFVYDEDTGLLIPELDIDKRFYKGCTLVTNKHIKELQDANEDNKPTGGWTPVEDDANGIWIPNKIHIKELREAIVKALGFAVNMKYTTKETISYFISKAGAEEKAIEKILAKSAQAPQTAQPAATDNVQTTTMEGK